MEESLEGPKNAIGRGEVGPKGLAEGPRGRHLNSLKGFCWEDREGTKASSGMVEGKPLLGCAYKIIWP